MISHAAPIPPLPSLTSIAGPVAAASSSGLKRGSDLLSYHIIVPVVEWGKGRWSRTSPWDLSGYRAPPNAAKRPRMTSGTEVELVDALKRARERQRLLDSGRERGKGFVPGPLDAAVDVVHPNSGRSLASSAAQSPAPKGTTFPRAHAPARP